MIHNFRSAAALALAFPFALAFGEPFALAFPFGDHKVPFAPRPLRGGVCGTSCFFLLLLPGSDPVVLLRRLAGVPCCEPPLDTASESKSDQSDMMLADARDRTCQQMLSTLSTNSYSIATILVINTCASLHIPAHSLSLSLSLPFPLSRSQQYFPEPLHSSRR